MESASSCNSSPIPLEHQQLQRFRSFLPVLLVWRSSGLWPSSCIGLFASTTALPSRRVLGSWWKRRHLRLRDPVWGTRPPQAVRDLPQPVEAVVDAAPAGVREAADVEDSFVLTKHKLSLLRASSWEGLW